MGDLNNDIRSDSGWTLEDALGINDTGQIVGYGTNPSGQMDAFVLTPIPEPGLLALLLLCCCSAAQQFCSVAAARRCNSDLWFCRQPTFQVTFTG